MPSKNPTRSFLFLYPVSPIPLYWVAPMGVQACLCISVSFLHCLSASLRNKLLWKSSWHSLLSQLSLPPQSTPVTPPPSTGLLLSQRTSLAKAKASSRHHGAGFSAELNMVTFYPSLLYPLPLAFCLPPWPSLAAPLRRLCWLQGLFDARGPQGPVLFLLSSYTCSLDELIKCCLLNTERRLISYLILYFKPELLQ